jgi:hypothetical protein
MVNLPLPRMFDFIASHIDRHVLVEETASKICTLCQDDLVKSEDVDFAGEKESSDQTDDNENLTFVHVLPCDHLFTRVALSVGSVVQQSVEIDALPAEPTSVG